MILRKILFLSLASLGVDTSLHCFPLLLHSDTGVRCGELVVTGAQQVCLLGLGHPPPCLLVTEPVSEQQLFCLDMMVLTSDQPDIIVSHCQSLWPAALL